MSPKELMYIEDALGHECFLSTNCENHASQLQDTDLRTLAQQLASKHRQCEDKMLGLLK